MADMLRDVRSAGAREVNVDAIKSDIRRALINKKANACPIALRLMWHASGTFDKADNSGGSDGATMRFEPESSDDANAGLNIVRSLLIPVAKAHPEVSIADIWGIASVAAVEWLGGPTVPFNFGRSDAADGATCPANGRLPDASQGAAHLRDVFHRMGFNDRDIVTLSGAHTLGRCHAARSGYDGPWTTKPLRFDNEYFVNLVEKTWVKREWDGPEQFEDKETGTLMMLPTDLCLMDDDAFRPVVEEYAKDAEAFRRDFADVYGRLMALGCPAHAAPGAPAPEKSDEEKASAEFREHAMHGSVHLAKALIGKANPHALEATSGRSALHKAAFWGHDDMTAFLIEEAKIDVNLQDHDGDSALHDAAKFGHVNVTKALLAAGSDVTLTNKAGQDAYTVANEHGHTAVADLIAAKMGDEAKMAKRPREGSAEAGAGAGAGSS